MKKSEETKLRILRFIEAYCDENGYPPTTREIGQHVGLSSPASVHAHMEKLAGEGAIVKDANRQRAYSLATQRFIQTQKAIPLLGQVAAGLPIYAQENVEDTFPLPPIFPYARESDENFMLRVQGDSMIDAGIFERDILIIHACHEAYNGEIVVARVDEDSYTVKRYYKHGTNVTLKAENPAYAPLERPLAEVEVIGKVVGLMRTM